MRDDLFPCLTVAAAWAFVATLTLRLELPPTLVFGSGVLLGAVLVMSLLIVLTKK